MATRRLRVLPTGTHVGNGSRSHSAVSASRYASSASREGLSVCPGVAASRIRVYEAVVDSAAAKARMVQNHRWRGADERLALRLVEADDRARPLLGCRRLPDDLRVIE